MSPRSFDQPNVGVGVLVRRADTLLLLRRRGVHGEGTWSTPGGHLNYGESPEECAVREVLEETGVSIDGVRFAGITNDVFEAEGRHYVTLWMEARWASGTARVAAEHEMSEVGWYALDALPSNLFLSLRHLIEGRGYGLPRPWSGVPVEEEP